HLDYFFSLVAGMTGRELWSGIHRLAAVTCGAEVDVLIRAERTRLPLRRRLKDRGKTLYRARQILTRALADKDTGALARALDLVDQGVGEASAWPGDEKYWSWLQRLWADPEPLDVWQDFSDAEPSLRIAPALPSLILHLREQRRFFPWILPLRAG